MQIVSPSYVEISKVIYEFWARGKCTLRFFTRWGFLAICKVPPPQHLQVSIRESLFVIVMSYFIELLPKVIFVHMYTRNTYFSSCSCCKYNIEAIYTFIV